ncbi:MAG: ABC transporter ATP-binding protein, partial [Thermoleophilaceae bacterium]
TAVLTPQEAQRLFDVMRELRDGGNSVIFISHKLPEVRAVADRITVIRRGKLVGRAGPDAGEAELASMMVGRPIQLRVSKPPSTLGPAALRVRAASLDDEDGRRLLDEVELTVREGEILGLAGVQGNGQSELVQMLLGHRRPTAGTVALGDVDLTGLSPREVLAAGVGYIPEDRRLNGLVGDFSVTENLILDTHDQPRFSTRGRLRPGEIKRHGEELMREFDVRAATPETPASALSGGNAQKVVLARELTRSLRLLVAVEPTRGLDVGSVEFVYRRLFDASGDGTAVVLVSSDLDEIVTLADRIAVMCEGRIVGTVQPGVSRAQLGLMMAGAAARAAA